MGRFDAFGCGNSEFQNRKTTIHLHLSSMLGSPRGQYVNVDELRTRTVQLLDVKGVQLIILGDQCLNIMNCEVNCSREELGSISLKEMYQKELSAALTN